MAKQDNVVIRFMARKYREAEAVGKHMLFASAEMYRSGDCQALQCWIRYFRAKNVPFIVTERQRRVMGPVRELWKIRRA